MFTFFQPKKYLLDILEGFIDIHNHILPSIDDGAQNISESINLLKEFRNIGIKNFICTPHIMNDYYGNDETTISNAHSSLKQALKQNQIEDISMSYAAEYMLDIQYDKLVEENNLLALKNNHVLIEMSYFQAPLNLNQITFSTFTNGYIPVLAHPERYSFYHSKFYKYSELKNQDIPFQMNMLSLTDHYGTSIKKTAYKLLEKHMVDFIATDIHRMEHLNKLREIHLPKKHFELLIPIVENTKKVFL